MANIFYNLQKNISEGTFLHFSPLDQTSTIYYKTKKKLP